MNSQSEIERLIRNASDSFDGKPWYGTSTLSILMQIPFSRINSVPKGFKKSIATLLRHMLAWRQFTLAKLGGDSDYRIPDDSTENWNYKAIRNESEWEELLQDLKQCQSDFLTILAGMYDDDLDLPVPGSIYNKDYLIRGIIQHDTFHLGQIALMMRALENEH